MYVQGKYHIENRFTYALNFIVSRKYVNDPILTHSLTDN